MWRVQTNTSSLNSPIDWASIDTRLGGYIVLGLLLGWIWSHHGHILPWLDPRSG